MRKPIVIAFDVVKWRQQRFLRAGASGIAITRHCIKGQLVNLSFELESRVICQTTADQEDESHDPGNAEYRFCGELAGGFGIKQSYGYCAVCLLISRAIDIIVLIVTTRPD